MSSTANIPSFDDIIQADRKRRQAETLANQLLGSGRKTNAIKTGASIDRKSTSSPVGSLASRVGVQKRSATTAPKSTIEGKWNHDLHHVNNPKTGTAPPRLPRNPSGSAVDKGSRTFASLQKNVESIVAPSAASNNRGGAQMSIRGMAAPGPYVVIASNFAPGTTAADIEAAMAPVGGEVTSCHLISARPNVMAEILFVDREGAENVVATFNNQKADGRVLYVYMKQGGPSPRSITSTSTSTPIPVTAPAVPPTKATPTGPRAPAPRDTLRDMLPRDPPPYDDHNDMEVDEEMTDAQPLSAPEDAVIVDVDAQAPARSDNNVRDARNNGGNFDRRDQRYDNRGARPHYQGDRYAYGDQYDRRDGGRDGGRGGGRDGGRDGGRRDYGRGGREQTGLYSDGMTRRDGGYRR